MARAISIRTKIATLSGACLAATALVLIGWNLVAGRQTSDFVQQRTEAALRIDANNYLETLATGAAGAVRREFTAALMPARDLAAIFAMLAGPDSAVPVDQRRAEINRILQAVLRGQPELNGTYTAWEPGALDGRDEANRDLPGIGTDVTGRFIPYWIRDPSGHVAMQPLVEDR